MLEPDSFGRAVAITPSDTVNLDAIAKAIYVGGAGNFVAVMEDDTTVTFNGATAGSILKLRVKRINSTSLTASNLVALYYD